MDGTFDGYIFSRRPNSRPTHPLGKSRHRSDVREDMGRRS